jgi:ferritin-like metal-binding protein YciE
MATATKASVLADWVSDVVAVESHIEEALDRQLKIKDAPPIIRQVHDTVRDSKHRAEAFRDANYRDGGNQNAIQKGAELLGKAAGIIDLIRKDTASKALRDDYVACNLAVVSYSMLHTTAIALEDEKVAAFAADGLKTYARVVTDINVAIPNVVVDELQKNPDVTVKDANAAAIATSQQQGIWAALA